MLLFNRNGTATFSRLAVKPLAAQQARGKMTAQAPLTVSSEVSRKLHKTQAWQRVRRKPNSPTVIDPRRVNVVSEGLCDDILKVLGPSIERHRGCDLVDLNPGAGLWSQKLHQFLEPRKHILMDLDAEFYRPFLDGLLSKKNVELIPKSGIVWKDLLEMMSTRLSHHRERKELNPQRNDALLVTLNLASSPKKPFAGFESIDAMVIYQLISSIRTASLFQRYGLVRMLIWINDDDKKRVLPRSLNRRRRGAFEAELSCAWIHEVASLDSPDHDRIALRDEWLNKESGYATMARMAAAGLEIPSGRETAALKELRVEPDLLGKRLAGIRAPYMARPFKQELEDLEKSFDVNTSRQASKRRTLLRQRDRQSQADALVYLDLLQQHENGGLLADTSSSQFKIINEQWNKRIASLKKNPRCEFKNYLDNYYLYRADPPTMLWDRRTLEPLAARLEEFYPNAPTTLLDIQPKAMNQVFRNYGPRTNHSGDMSDILLRTWFNQTTISIQKAMDSLWGGFGDLVGDLPSVVDRNNGGTPMTKEGAFTARTLNEQQWTQIMHLWLDWPFAPSFHVMLGRLAEEGDSDIDEEEKRSNAMGLNY